MISNKIYSSGPIASTDIHAGGIFFCQVYQELIQLDETNQIRWWREPLDSKHLYWLDLEKFYSSTKKGTFSIAKNGRVYCQFENESWEGIESLNRLIFYIYNKKFNSFESKVFDFNSRNFFTETYKSENNNEISEPLYQDEIIATKVLLDICNQDNYKNSFVDSIESCLKSLLIDDINSASEHHRNVPLGGMGRFDDWLPIDPNNRKIFNLAIKNWSRVMNTHTPVRKCPCCGRLRHSGPCFEYFGK